MADAKPYTKEQQLGASRKKKYRRRVASPKQWEAIRAEKLTECRLCGEPRQGELQLHHIVPRTAPWFGGDDPDNLVPLDAIRHDAITRRVPQDCRDLLSSLTDAEYAYAIATAGEDFFERYYRVEFRDAA